MTSDSGSLLLREIDRATNLSSPMSNSLFDYRDKAKVHHGYEEPLRQRLFAIAMGYEDGNNHQTCPLILSSNRQSISNRGRAKARRKFIKTIAKAQPLKALRAPFGIKNDRLSMVDKRSDRKSPPDYPMPLLPIPSVGLFAVPPWTCISAGHNHLLSSLFWISCLSPPTWSK